MNNGSERAPIAKIIFLMMLMANFFDTNAQGNNKEFPYVQTVYKTP